MAKRCSRVVPGLLMQCMKEDNDQQGCRCLLLADMNYTSLVAIFSVFVALRSRFPRQICMSRELVIACLAYAGIQQSHTRNITGLR